MPRELVGGTQLGEYRVVLRRCGRVLVDVGHWSAASWVKGRSYIGVSGSKGTLTVGKLSTLLRLNRAKVVAPTAAMIDEVALSESLLEVLAGLRLETSWSIARILRLSVTCAGAFSSQLTGTWSNSSILVVA